MSTLVLRPAVPADVEHLQRWDTDPHVIAATTDDADAESAFDHDWAVELAAQTAVSHYLLAELDGRPIGAMQICDPYEEPTHYWGDVEPHLRAIDIWIGDPTDRGCGHGETMMRLAIQRCFAAPDVTAIVIDPLRTNTRVHAFYARLGFVPEGRRIFDDGSDCLVFRLTRDDWRRRFPADAGG